MITPVLIRMHERDNVAIVANDGGLPAGTVLPGGLMLREQVPQGHKVALVDIAAGARGAALRRGDRHARRRHRRPAAGCTSACCEMPAARALDGLPIATVKPAAAAAARGLHLRGLPQRRRLGRHAQHPGDHARRCSAWPACVDFAVQRIKAELLPQYPNVDDVVGLEHGYGCGVAIDAPDAMIPIRTLRNISLNPNFGGEVMVVSLGCEKLQPERLLPPGTIPIVDEPCRCAASRSTSSACRTTRTSASCR